VRWPAPILRLVRLQTLPLAVATAAVFLLAGCGPDGSPTTNPPAGGNTGAGPGNAVTPSCDWAPASLINSTLGTHVGEAQAQNLNKVVVCRYTPTAGSTGSVVLRIQTDMSAADFTAARANSDANNIPTANFPGFVDDAYTSTLKAGSIVTNTVVARKGTVEILVSSPASFEQEKNLESQIFAKFS